MIKIVIYTVIVVAITSVIVIQINTPSDDFPSCDKEEFKLIKDQETKEYWRSRCPTLGPEFKKSPHREW